MPTITLITGALSTLARVKAFLGLIDSKYDDTLTLLINQATGFIQTYCSRTFKRATHTDEEHDGNDTDTILLKHFPVISISSFQYNSATDNTDDWQTFETKDYFFYEDGRVKAVGGNLLNSPQRYRATYVGGYLIDFTNENDTSLHTLPSELEMALMILVSGLFNRRRAQGISTDRMGDQSTTFTDILKDPSLQEILDKYATRSL